MPHNVVTIKTDLGAIRLNKFSKKHAQANHHRNPLRNKQLLEALTQNSFRVVDTLDSAWKGHKTQNLVVLVNTTLTTTLVVLKRIAKEEFLFITSYIPRPKQLNKYALRG